jgi:hypothetical protein
MAICLPFSPRRYRVIQLMRTFESKSKTLLKVSQRAYVRLLSKQRQQGLTMSSVGVHERFRVCSSVKIPQSADATRPVASVTKFTPSIQIP